MVAGQHIGSYTVEAAVAHGRSGVVYRAISASGRRVALKIHDRPDAAADEAACLRSVHHERVINLEDDGCTETGGAWIALSWVEGQTLAYLFDTEAPLELERTRRIVEQIGDGLDALHAAGFVHGDLAPSNILVSGDDQVTIVDLATATRVGAASQPLDTTVGVELETTPRYASPEVAKGERPAPASDIYALGLIAYEALTGTSPFAEVATPIAMLSHHASSVPEPLSEKRPDLPGDVEDALSIALSKSGSQRPSSASEFSRLIAKNGPGNSGSRTSRARSAKVALVCVGALVAVGLLVMSSRTSEPSLTGEDAQLLATRLSVGAGDAAAATCNLVVGAGFDAGNVPEHYYSGDRANTTAAEPGAGVDASSALRVGANGAYGIFGEIVPIIAGEPLILSGWMRLQGEPQVTMMYVDYLDADFQKLAAEVPNPSEDNVGTPDGSRALVVSEPPAAAAYAVPTFFKDSSGGSLFVDEVVFGALDRCRSEVDS